jgi:hypothetical protein
MTPSDSRAVLWQAWQLACEEAGAAYRAWSRAPREPRAEAYWAYVAAADREAAAAEGLRAALAPSRKAA